MTKDKFDFIENVDLFYNKLQDECHRFLSWEHCYLYFYKNFYKNNCTDYDTAALNLAFYLASWGMYRGSSSLLQYDYKIHIGLLKKLLDKKYEKLWQSCLTQNHWKLVEDAIEVINNYYPDAVSNSGIKVSITLSTKILMGIFGCTPAYDKFFRDGLKYYCTEHKKDNITRKCNNDNWLLFRDIINNHENAIKKYRLYSAKEPIQYPPMKLIDMYFWIIGYSTSPYAIKNKTKNMPTNSLVTQEFIKNKT